MASNEKINDIRERIRSAFNSEPANFDRCDIEKVLTNDVYVRRFLNAGDDDVNHAFRSLIKTLKWRKSIGINDMKQTDFPMEFYATGVLSIYCNDKNDIPVIYSRMSRSHPIPEFRELVSRFSFFLIEKLASTVDKSGKSGYGMVIDYRDSGLSNIDIQLSKEVFESIGVFYPGYIEYIVLFEMGIVQRTLFTMMKSWLPETYSNKFVFLKRKEIVDFIGSECLPEFLGGKCSKPLGLIYDDCPKLEEVARHVGISKKAVLSFSKSNDKYVREAYEIREKGNYEN